MPAIVSTDGKYGDNDPRLKLHPEEPYFFLRAQDALAPAAVEAYAGLLEVAARANRAGQAAMLHESSQRVMEFAQRMRGWQATHADLVKLPD